MLNIPKYIEILNLLELEIYLNRKFAFLYLLLNGNIS